MRLFSLIVIVSLVLQLWLPWWTVMAVPLVVCCLQGSPPGRSFLISFLAVFLLWCGASVFIHLRTGGLLTGRVSILLQIGSPVLLILLTAFIGGLAAGTAGWTGALIRRLL